MNAGPDQESPGFGPGEDVKHAERTLVSGAASGIGKALSLQLLGDRANVIALDRDSAALHRLASPRDWPPFAVPTRCNGPAKRTSPRR